MQSQLSYPERGLRLVQCGATVSHVLHEHMGLSRTPSLTISVWASSSADAPFTESALREDKDRHP